VYVAPEGDGMGLINANDNEDGSKVKVCEVCGHINFKQARICENCDEPFATKHNAHSADVEILRVAPAAAPAPPQPQPKLKQSENVRHVVAIDAEPYTKRGANCITSVRVRFILADRAPVHTFLKVERGAPGWTARSFWNAVCPGVPAPMNLASFCKGLESALIMRVVLGVSGSGYPEVQFVATQTSLGVFTIAERKPPYGKWEVVRVIDYSNKPMSA
jgi:hypothetical protein